MARNDKNNISLSRLTKRQASVINRGNKKISGNINSLMDDISTMTYGIKRTDKIDSLMDEFNSLMKTEIDTISKKSDGDTTSFITKLFSENNKRMANAVKDIEEIFNANEGQLEAFMTEKYRNRMIKQQDLHEVATQLVELREAVGITRDAIVSADIVDGDMSRTLTVDTSDVDEDKEDYIPIIEETERRFKLQKKIKNFIIPRSLEYGEYYVYCIPYSKIFEDFSKEKNSFNGKYHAYSESVVNGNTVYDTITEKTKKEFITVINESAKTNPVCIRLKEDVNKNYAKLLTSEVDTYLKNITINNNSVPLCILEEGADSFREYYNAFIDESVTETTKKSNKDSEYDFDSVMSNIDTGVHSTESTSKRKKSGDKFDNIKDCYIKLIDPMHLLPIKIMNEVIGYYYIQEEDISPLAGILTSTMYYDINDNHHESNVLDMLSEIVVDAFDKSFLNKNMKFKKIIVECLNYFKLNNKKVKFQFIPKEYIVPFKINEDENGDGVSIIEPSLFYAKLYLMLLLFKVISIIQNSNDTKINYIRQSGIDKNVANKIQDIIRKKQQRQINLSDMFSYTTLINKVGQGSEIYIPVGKGNEHGIETEILSGQDIQLNTELMEMLKKAYISGTGVPDVLMNYINEADFAKTLELANNRFQGRVTSFQLDYNEQITHLYKVILRYSTTLPDSVIDSFKFNFMQPKYHNNNITNDLLSNHVALQDFLVGIFFGQEGIDDPNNKEKINKFKKLLAEDRLPMLKFDELEKLYNESLVKGTKDNLNPDKQESQ